MEASAIDVVTEGIKAMAVSNAKKLAGVAGGDGGVEAKTATTATVAVATESDPKKKKIKNKNHRIQVSGTKRPLFFYCNLAKRYIKQYNDVELSALGMAIPAVITISETLKRNGFAVQKRISTSTVGSKDDEKGRIVQKPQIEILLGKAEKLEETTVAAAIA